MHDISPLQERQDREEKEDGSPDYMMVDHESGDQGSDADYDEEDDESDDDLDIERLKRLGLADYR